MTKEEFRAIRLKLGLTQAELGKVMGMEHQTAVSRIELRRGPTMQQAAHIRTLLKAKEGKK